MPLGHERSAWRRWTPARVAWAAAWLAALSSLLGSPVAVALHVAFVRHVRCAEHGELVDVTGARGGRPFGAVRPRRAQWTDTSARTSAPGHEHCFVAPGGLTAAQGPTVRHGLQRAASQGVSCHRPGARARVRRRIYLYAPKQSPTAV